MEKCKHCKMSVEIRNPSGFCDHLHYPEACEICDKRENPSIKAKTKTVVVHVKGGVVAIFPLPRDIRVLVKDYDCVGCSEGVEDEDGEHYHIAIYESPDKENNKS